ncbi:alcohol dehydrogenase catalytic domain-containing protein [Halomarina halobia]|uniref:Alcohol dehydrogenase catalytic domain-containing protein n=1 Tax=Halomarina halobia TaxID=3033386 RepID=A0ABD6AG32_9EURY|nr:zinc-binding dehydrogenase [Halomarina sp. PSR21]
MRAAAFTGFGSPEHVSVEPFDDPDPEPDEAIVDVGACSINHHDLWILNGDLWIGEDDLPFVAGMDVAGTVTAVGADVHNVEPGDRVLLCPNETCGSCRYCREGPESHCKRFSLYHGGLAEQASVQADRLVHLPDDVDLVDAAALPVAYMTALRMLKQAEVGVGDLVFVPGATGGVGVAAIQLIDAIGARSIGTSTSKQKLDRLEDLGVDYTIESGDPDEIRSAVVEISRVDATLNHLGGPFSDVGLNVLRRGGRMVICGQTAGPTSELTLGDLFLNQKRVLGNTMGTQTDLEQLVDLIAAGDLDPVVNETYTLDQTSQAFADMNDRSVFGKLVVTP